MSAQSFQYLGSNEVQNEILWLFISSQQKTFDSCLFIAFDTELC